MQGKMSPGGNPAQDHNIEDPIARKEGENRERELAPTSQEFEYMYLH